MHNVLLTGILSMANAIRDFTVCYNCYHLGHGKYGLQGIMLNVPSTKTIHPTASVYKTAMAKNICLRVSFGIMSPEIWIGTVGMARAETANVKAWSRFSYGDRDESRTFVRISTSHDHYIHLGLEYI
ncbi:hypothetical protein WR25_10649 [Diploscapter pachys]|uniref:Uncharacterized protein n=1 Tax=Diploscapter pachys TaxID=2018661 RepID=A0A2A2M134_9BILA|nr:hypothetical protein WR25_10649 [Diploscapter pachys]